MPRRSSSIINVGNIIQTQSQNRNRYDDPMFDKKRNPKAEWSKSELAELDFVKSEFELDGLRIDTLAFNKESGVLL